jgi:hypothetical protein
MDVDLDPDQFNGAVARELLSTAYAATTRPAPIRTR